VSLTLESNKSLFLLKKIILWVGMHELGIL
jgi:hypothetical protein